MLLGIKHLITICLFIGMVLEIAHRHHASIGNAIPETAGAATPIQLVENLAVELIWFEDLSLSIIVGAAMIINILSAGFFGFLIPYVFNRIKIDPALASSVFVTTITDVFGFLSFLGLASIYLF